MIGPVRQIASLVSDLDEAMARYSSLHRIGPWFASDPMPTARSTYRGRPAPVRIRAASAYSDELEIELIQPLDEEPSIYREAIERIGFGLHHVCYHSDDLEADLGGFLAGGYELVQEFYVGSFRIVYVGRPGEIGSYVELIELDPQVTALLAGWRQAAAEWDGVHRVTRLHP